MTPLFNTTREFVKQCFKGNKAQMLHFDRTVYWLQQLKPNADEAFLIAALGHDIERAFRDGKETVDNTGKSFLDISHLTLHQEEGAEILGNFLEENQADENLISRVKHLVSKHEIGGDPDQDLLKDVDSLSFVENNAEIFISRLDKLGYEKIKEKFDWMYNRISNLKVKEIAKPFYDNLISKLEKAGNINQAA